MRNLQKQLFTTQISFLFLSLSFSLLVLVLLSLCPQGYGVACLPVVFFIKRSPRSFFSVAAWDGEQPYCGFLINLWIFDLLKQ